MFKVWFFELYVEFYYNDDFFDFDDFDDAEETNWLVNDIVCAMGNDYQNPKESFDEDEDEYNCFSLLGRYQML